MNGWWTYGLLNELMYEWRRYTESNPLSSNSNYWQREVRELEEIHLLSFIAIIGQINHRHFCMRYSQWMSCTATLCPPVSVHITTFWTRTGSFDKTAYTLDTWAPGWCSLHSQIHPKYGTICYDVPMSSNHHCISTLIYYQISHQWSVCKSYNVLPNHYRDGQWLTSTDTANTMNNPYRETTHCPDPFDCNHSMTATVWMIHSDCLWIQIVID